MSVTPTKSGFSKNKIKKKKRSIDQDTTPAKQKKSKNRNRSRSTHTRSKIKNKTLDRKNSYNTPLTLKISNSNNNNSRKKINKTLSPKFSPRFLPRVKNSSPTARIETIQNLRQFSDQFTPINEKKNKKPTSKIVSVLNQDQPSQIEKQSFKLVIWTINSSFMVESEMSSQQFSTSSYSSKNTLSFLETNLPLLMYEEEEERYKIFRNFSLKQRTIIINSLVSNLISIKLMKLVSLIRISPKFSQMNTNLAELLRNALSKQKLDEFDPMLCKNVLIEIIKTIPNDTLLPINFLTDILLDNDRSTFEDLKPFLKNKYQLSIWKDLVKYWKHCYDAKLDDITEISLIFGSAILNSTLNNPEKLSKYSEESVLLELNDIEQIYDQESKTETEISFPIIEGNVLITTEKRRRRLLRKEKLKRFLHNNTTNKNQTPTKNKKKKKNRKENKNRKSNEEDSLSDISSKINEENENIWIKIYLKLTPKRIEFYQTKNGELIGSLSLNTLKLYQKSHGVGDISRTGGKIQENEENEKSNNSQQQDVENDNDNDKNDNLSNSSSILKNQSPIHETELSQSEDHIFIIAENQIYNSVLINVGSKKQVNKWTSNILIRKRSIINDLPFISKMLSLKDHKNQILHSLLVSKNMSLVAAILENFDTRIHQNNFESGEAIARSLVISFHSKNRVLRLLRWMIFQETVNGKNNTRTLFRSSSLSAKLIPIFAHIVAHDFLVKTLSNTIEMVSKVKSHLEVDEDRVGKQMAEKNRNALILLTNEFLAKIILSERETPLPFRIICRAMKKAVSRVFPESSYKSLNNFLFLRFFVPAIATPEAFGIMEKKDIDITLRRNLVSISKLIQSVGNQSEGLKGTLSCLNGFVKQSATRILKYFEQIAEIPNDDQEWNFNSCPLPQNQVEEALVMLKNHITTNWQDIKDVLTHSDSRSNFSVFVSDFIENLITYKEGLKTWK
ncbi:ras gtpase-activating protein [Anaeramoeba flamelloides]|uniref:Ras gtpase-activating protein n=1 Tax=Anaeramoeba flamelloides TaxID=1746091 RepID=A0AAV7YE55_9EUKA|nr:ras gtpase-activating protein [Anaeramoeba flamelloides]